MAMGRAQNAPRAFAEMSLRRLNKMDEDTGRKQKWRACADMNLEDHDANGQTDKRDKQQRTRAAINTKGVKIDGEKREQNAAHMSTNKSERAQKKQNEK